MTKTELLNLFSKANSVQPILSQIREQNPKIFQLKNLIGSSKSFYTIELFKQANLPFIFILKDKETATYHLNELEDFLGHEEVLFYPSSYRRPYEIEETDNANVLLRAEVLNRLNSGKKPVIIVTYPNALFEKVVTKSELSRNTLKINRGDRLDLDFVNETLFEYDFKRVDFVTKPGEFSVRGGIIDIYSFSHDEPYRIEFFGDEIESIRTFDIETQLSNQTHSKASIMPNVENKYVQEKRQSFLEYIKQQSLIITENPELLKADLNELFKKAENNFKQLSENVSYSKPSELFCHGDELIAQLQNFNCIQYHNQNFLGASDNFIFTCHTSPQPAFNKKFDLLIDDLEKHQKSDYTNVICRLNQQQAQRFHDIFEDMQFTNYQTLVLGLHEGFIDHNSKLVCYTDHQIFERYHKFKLKNKFSKQQAITLKELTQLERGDYVTHIDHGIGKFGGLQKIEVNGNTQEAIKLVYGEGDVLYLNIHALHKISKYNGKDGQAPKVYKLGSKAWKKLKQKTKTRVKKIAFDLIKLYAKRKLKKGFQFGPDSYLQHELEASFIYEDTPDQSTATEAVKKDMESQQPMDRLVCGDVGFGKTEVAIRVAFKAVDNGKQVAVLVPTTILAFQHHKTFSERLKDFPVTIDYINRFKTAKEKRETLSDLKSKDLGLLIIDEEQKFSVAVKDKLKNFKTNVDTLTLTATPIPRTLQFSLMVARDLSTITTPPPNRYPIETRVIRFSEDAIRDAINYELQRGGQLFFIHNRIENINEVAGLLQRLVPDAKIGIGHGQMEGKKLEQLMLSFMNSQFDVLVSTTIIESGLDITNANTIIINNANHFGVSDLHQMRGRVGRSNKKAFCYLITPSLINMTPDARKRITALEQFSDLGSGIKIAMKDLEIRGAGDLLGGEQSGFINEIGFDTYQKILNEAIEELKENEFKDLYKSENQNVNKDFVKDVQIDTDFETLFPDDYINNITERLNLYTKLNDIKTSDKLESFKDELKDRFGDLPIQVIDLLDSVKLKWTAAKVGIEKLVIKQHKMIGYFIANQESSFYQSNQFRQVLAQIQQSQNQFILKEKKTRNGLRLVLNFGHIENIEHALQKINKLTSP
ncbi:transcription-repair coupling factor [Flavobacterium sp. CS20]|uniref:transcription-repair coupling factor n=1 Tax=Flavobacterium sp. CS20 TaxID=2775246 RepID=UPI001B3A1EC8|nr:transcription-repair coupling factor [Flavobacterium sp. CS20]QTY28046.1 transcription-repair coupling factor [Flavobacterium sp. CS20]